MHAIGFVASITHNVVSKFTLGRLRTHEYFSFRSAIALGVQLEVMDQALHTARDLPLRRRYNLWISDAIIAGRHTFQSLIHNVEALLHLKHTDQVTVVDVTI